MEHVRDAPEPVLLVSAADKLHNARSILLDLRTDGEVVWSRFKGGKEGTLWYYRALVDAFSDSGGPDRIVDELEGIVEELENRAVAQDGTGRL